MPQISKHIPIKGYKSQPSVLSAREYLTLTGNMYSLNSLIAVSTGTTEMRYIFHATKSYELSFEFICSSWFRISLFECLTLISGVEDGELVSLNRTNRKDPGFGVGYMSDIEDDIESIIDVLVLPDSMLYRWGENGIRLVCAPGTYYAFYFEHDEVDTEIVSATIFVGDISEGNL